MRLSTPSCLVLIALWAASGPTLGADRTVEALELSFALEARLFESAFQRYQIARDEEQEATSRFTLLTERVDSVIMDEDSSKEDLWAAESELVSARNEFLSASLETASHRRAVYQQLDRLTEIGMAIERQRDRSLVKTEKLDGRWRIDLTPANEFGLIELRLDGTLVTGAYRLSSGAQGSLRGTYANHKLTIERVDTSRGFDMTLIGIHDPVTGEIRGTWDAKDVSGTHDTYGEWVARKLSPAQEREVLLPH